MFHDASVRRSYPKYISASLMGVYSDGAGVVTKGKHRQRNDSFTTVEMYVDSICAFSWTLQYEVSRFIFPIRVHSEGHFMCMDVIMRSIPRRNNLQEHGWRVLLITWLFTDRPEGTSKEH